MPLQLDHIVIAVEDRETAIQSYSDLGFTVVRGGVHANQATHNALIVFSDGTYLELLALTGQPPLPDFIDFSTMLDSGEGLAGFALRTPNIEAERERLQRQGFSMSAITGGSRLKASHVMRWRMAFIDDGFAPFLIQDITSRTWRIPDDSGLVTHPNQVTGIHAVEFAVPDLSAAQDRHSRLFGSVPKTIILTEDRTRDQSAMLAVHLNSSATPAPSFPLDHTHGVQFRLVS